MVRVTGSLYVQMVLIYCRYLVASSVAGGGGPDSGCETDSDLDGEEDVKGPEVEESSTPKL